MYFNVLAFIHVLDYSITYFGTGPNRQKHDGRYNDAVEMIQSNFAWIMNIKPAMFETVSHQACNYS